MRNAVELQNFEYYLEDDWDGDGAKAVSPITLQNAQVILTALPLELQKGSAMAGIDGSIGLYWTSSISGGRRQIYIDVRADGRIRMLYGKNESSIEEVFSAGTPIQYLLDWLEPGLILFIN
jgi:hypothetical protein